MNDTTHLRDQIRTKLRRYFYIYIRTNLLCPSRTGTLNVAFYLEKPRVYQSNPTQWTNQVHMVRNPPGCMKKNDAKKFINSIQKFGARKASLWSQLDEMRLDETKLDETRLDDASWSGNSAVGEIWNKGYFVIVCNRDRTQWQFNILPSRPGGVFKVGIRSLPQLLRSRCKTPPFA